MVANPMCWDIMIHSESFAMARCVICCVSLGSRHVDVHTCSLLSLLFRLQAETSKQRRLGFRSTRWPC